mgnify:CR=1 FL=1
MKPIKLTQGKYAIVDDEDFEWLNQWKWCVNHDYAVRTVEKGKMIWMHKIINKTPTGYLTDHINRNKLDNRKENLRTVTSSQNKINVGLRKDNTSGYAGISWHKKIKKFYVRIKINQKNIDLGYYYDFKYALLARKWGEGYYWERRCI